MFPSLKYSSLAYISPLLLMMLTYTCSVHVVYTTLCVHVILLAQNDGLVGEGRDPHRLLGYVIFGDANRKLDCLDCLGCLFVPSNYNILWETGAGLYCGAIYCIAFWEHVVYFNPSQPYYNNTLKRVPGDFEHFPKKTFNTLRTLPNNAFLWFARLMPCCV